MSAGQVLARWTLLAVALGFVGYTTYEWIAHGFESKYILMLTLLSLGLLTAGWPFKSAKTPMMNVAITTLTLFVGLLGVELFMSWQTTAGMDNRGRIEVINDLRAEGTKAYPVLSPHLFMDPKVDFHIDNKEMVPLSGLSNTTTVFCNENGQYTIYQSDNYGFNNPKSAWQHDTLDVLLIGDSFAHGACVDQENTIAGQLRNTFPATVNLGMNASGPLIELAIMREYLQVKPVKTVFWVYYEDNDIFRRLEPERGNLETELRLGKLNDYLKPNYRQNVVKYQSEIQKAMALFAENRIQKASSRTRRLDKIILSAIKKPLQLKTIKTLLTQQSLEEQPLDFEKQKELLSKFDEILALAKADATKANAKLVFVYLPSKASLTLETAHPMYDSVLEVVQKHNLPIVDLYPEFKNSTDPMGLFPKKGSHYNETGYELVSQYLAKYLLHQPEQ